VGWQMQFGCVLIHCRRRLGAAVADDAVETQCGYGVLAQRALEGCAAVHRFGGVISHVPIVLLPRRNPIWPLGAQPLGGRISQVSNLERAGPPPEILRRLVTPPQSRPEMASAERPTRSRTFLSAPRAWRHGLSARPRSHPSQRRRCSLASGRSRRHIGHRRP
jgi:hypothetical protein